MMERDITTDIGTTEYNESLPIDDVCGLCKRCSGSQENACNMKTDGQVNIGPDIIRDIQKRSHRQAAIANGLNKNGCKRKKKVG